jgi:hypothetical protein
MGVFFTLHQVDFLANMEDGSKCKGKTYARTSWFSGSPMSAVMNELKQRTGVNVVGFEEYTDSVIR